MLRCGAAVEVVLEYCAIGTHRAFEKTHIILALSVFFLNLETSICSKNWEAIVPIYISPLFKGRKMP